VVEDYFNQRVAEYPELTVQITATDNEIDNRVFYLYGLTDEERKNSNGRIRFNNFHLSIERLYASTNKLKTNYLFRDSSCQRIFDYCH